MSLLKARVMVLAMFDAPFRRLSFGDVVTHCAKAPAHMSSDETRAAIASLVDRGLLVLTDDLHLRLRRRKHVAA